MNHILTNKAHGMKIAVIENEFGEVGVDDALVMETEEEVFEMNNGCICCTVRGDLLRIFEKLTKRGTKFDHILIETAGLAGELTRSTEWVERGRRFRSTRGG